MQDLHLDHKLIYKEEKTYATKVKSQTLYAITQFQLSVSFKVRLSKALDITTEVAYLMLRWCDTYDGALYLGGRMGKLFEKKDSYLDLIFEAGIVTGFGRRYKRCAGITGEAGIQLLKTQPRTQAYPLTLPDVTA